MQPGFLGDSGVNLISVMRNVDNSLDSMTGHLNIFPGGVSLRTDNDQGSLSVNLSGNSVYLSAFTYNGDFPEFSQVSVSPERLELNNSNGNIYIGSLSTTDVIADSRPLLMDNTGRLILLNTWPSGNSRVYVDTTYTPDFTALNNVASVSGGITAVMRIGNIVHVSGLITISPDSASGTHTSLEISLPWFTTQGNKYTCTGTGFNSDYQMGAQIVGDPANNKALFKFASLTTNPVDFSFSFQYIINTQGE
jgi:hypothetical protein